MMSQVDQLDSGELLLSHDGVQGDAHCWLDLAATLRPRGVSLFRSYSRAESLARIRQGMVAGAVLDAGNGGVDAISLMRSIRSVDRSLPCWLIAGSVDRRTLEAAWELQVRSVLLQPIDVAVLTAAVLGGVYAVGRSN